MLAGAPVFDGAAAVAGQRIISKIEDLSDGIMRKNRRL
jgi:hypothetical protein